MSESFRDRVVDLVRVPASELRPHPGNWRRHSDAQRRILRDLIFDDVGFADALIARRLDDGGYMVLDGHLRRDLMGNAEVPVLVLDVTEEEADKLLATLDPLASMAQTDTDAFRQLVEGMETDSESIRALLEEIASGGSAADIPGGAFKPEIQEDEAPVDRAEELREKWGTERGQVWEIPGRAGMHRVMCGDSTVKKDVERLLNGNRPRLCVTDPPYGVDYDPAWRNEAAEKGYIAHAATRVGDVPNDDRSDWFDAWMLIPSDVLYCWHALLRASSVHFSLERAGFEVRMQIVWAKSRFAISRGHYHVQHEPCFYAVRKGRTAGWLGGHDQTTLWRFNLDGNVEGGHSTQKPVAAMAIPVRNHEGDVYDPFLGSGTTIVACEQTGRVGYGMEIEPKYLAVVLERLAANLGLEPGLAQKAP